MKTIAALFVFALVCCGLVSITAQVPKASSVAAQPLHPTQR